MGNKASSAAVGKRSDFRRLFTCASAGLLALLLLGTTATSRAAPGWPDCAAGEVVTYRLDKRNATGWQHSLDRPIGDETAWFVDGDLMINRSGSVLRYITSGGGSGLRVRVGRAPALPEDDPRATLQYITYELGSVAAPGQPDHFLMINGDIYWPSCKEPCATRDAACVEAVITGFRCGDNCYLIVDIAGRGEVAALCEAPQCEHWIQEGDMPGSLLGTGVSLRLDQGRQVDGGGNAMGEFPAVVDLYFR